MRKANSEQSNNTKETINYYPFGSEMRMSSPYQIIRKNGITQGGLSRCVTNGVTINDSFEVNRGASLDILTN